MKLFKVFLLMMCAVGSLSLRLHAQTVLLSEGFETDGEGSRYFSNTYSECPFPNDDYFLRINSNPARPSGTCAGFQTAFTNMQGSFYWAGEDIRSSSVPPPGARPPGQIDFAPINITSFSALQVSLFLACSANGGRWENSDSLNIQASINGGPFRTVGRFAGDAAFVGELRVDANLDGVAEGVIASVANFTNYSFPISGTGSTLVIRLDFDMLGGTEEIAIDGIVVSGTVIFPVNWTSFDADAGNSDVRLRWTTGSELENNKFVVERRGLEGGFVAIGELPAKGSGSSYAFTDAAPFEGENFYRIRQIDLDNSSSYSEVREVVFSPKMQWQIAPNPSNGLFQVSTDLAKDYHWEIIDAFGAVKLKGFEADSQAFDLDASQLASGIYFLRIADSKQVLGSRKLVIQH